MLFQAGSTSRMRYQMFQSVVSVGPPTLTISAPGATARKREGRLTGIQSPPANPSRNDGANASPRRSACSISISSIAGTERSEEHTSELQSPCNLVCRLLLEKKKKQQ